MSLTDRQNRLLVAEDWKRIYQSYRNAEFKSYDFDNLRRILIDYIRENYPEDFNDYIESSEYLALIDLIAFLGQNIAFRIDLNARENYLELAERRESVLRLARLLSYNPKRNICAKGLLKVVDVSTTESVVDSNGINLQNQTITWNDPSNPNWYEQFIKIINRALPANKVFGNPTKSATISGITTQQYQFNSIQTGVPVYTFNRSINGSSKNFQIVGSDFETDITEKDPLPGEFFSLLYREDGKGPGSSNTGFFSLFKQGLLEDGEFSITNPSTNQVVAIDVANINNTDVWLYSLNNQQIEEELWTKVDAVEGNNVIYNSLSKKIRNIYSVLTRVEDRISLIFSDGVFGNLPSGDFRVYYRTSANENLTITPRDMAGISIDIPYVTRTNTQETLTLTYELISSIENASVSETNESIKLRAPANYYTQNRLITAEDYQIGPLAVSQEIVKLKSINRIASGVSRYFDLLDATGKYSKTNLFGTDGILYFEKFLQKTSFAFTTQADIQGAIINVIQPILNSKNIRNYYYNSFPAVDTADLNITWLQVTSDTNLNTGLFQNQSLLAQQLGSYTSSVLQLIRINSMVKFVPPAGQHFTPDGKLQTGEANYLGATTYKWCKVINVSGNGALYNDDNTGPVLLNDIIPTGALLTEIIPSVAKVITDDVQRQIIDQAFAFNTFGLRYDRTLGQWRIITESNLNVIDNFSIGKTGDSTNQKLDASWLLKFTTTGNSYIIEYRSSRYIFESDSEIRFYFDSSDKIYNTLTGKVVKDRITILNNNNKPDSLTNFTTDFLWEITEEFRDPVGYVNSKKVQITFFDNDDDGVVDDPDMFFSIVNPDINVLEKYIFLEQVNTADGVEDFNYVSNDILQIIVKQNKSALGALSQYDDAQKFYFIDTDTFEQYNKTQGITSLITNYRAFLGRDNLKFQYVHAADDSTRIDPSISNIIDTFVLTKTYDTEFRRYLTGRTTVKPLPPSSDNLQISFGSEINKIKSLTDEIIYHPVKYRVLFGDKADISLQSKFKIVKNPELVLNDNEIKSRVITLVNNFFALENWDFGDTFYFSELSAYVMQEMAPDIVTMIIVPSQISQSFGSLYEIKSEVDEIFINGATVNDLEIIDAVTATRLRASGLVVTSTSSTNTGIQSS